MKIIYADKDLERILNGDKSTKYRKLAQDKKFMQKLAEVINRLERAAHVKELSMYSTLHYEKLTNKSVYSSVRIIAGRVERLLFIETEDGLSIYDLQLNQDHYGNKK